MDVRAAAKAHALAHPHDLRLEAGINPPKRGVHEVISDVRTVKVRSCWAADEEVADDKARERRLPD